MPNDKYRILSTKPLSQEQLQLAAAHGIAVEEQAFIDIVPVKNAAVKPAFEKGGTFVFSSPNAVKSVVEQVDDRSKAEIRVYCIQGATKQAVEALLPEAIIVGIAPNSKELAELMLKDMSADAQQQHKMLKDLSSGAQHSQNADAVKDVNLSQSKTITFCCGNIRRDELPDMLRNAGVTVNEIVVYETHETPKPLIGTYDGVMFFSPSSVRSFFNGNTLPASTICFAIGHTTGAALQERTDNNIVTSPEASVDALLQTVILHFDNIK